MPTFNIEVQFFDIEADNDEAACVALGQSLASCKYDFMVLELDEQGEEE